MSLTKLNEVYSEWATGDGVFTELNALDVPWKDELNPNLYKNLNMSYHGAYSGDKNISPIVYKFLKGEDENTREKLANIIYTMYNDKWSKLWALMALEYNPIENYNMLETETPAEVTHTITPAETTETITPAETTTETKPAKTTVENDVSAFNSGDYADNTKTTTTGDVNDKGVESIDVDTAGTNKVEVDTAGSDVLTVQNERTLERTGNVGVTTTQQMAQSEIELRKWLYFESVFKDIDNILTLSIY